GKTNFVDALVLASDMSFDAASAVQARGGLAAIRRWGIEETDPIQGRIRAAMNRELLDAVYVEHSFSLVSHEGTEWRFQDETYEELNAGRTALRLTRTEGTIAETMPFKPDALPPTTSLMLFARQLVPWNTLIVRRLQLDLSQMRSPQPRGEAGKLEESGRNLTSVLRRLRSQAGGSFEFVLAAMRRLIPGLEDIVIEDAGGFLVLRFSQQQASGVAHFTASQMSEGALRALGIIVAAQTVTRPADHSTDSPELLIVEEPEVAIHPGAAALLFEVLKRASLQGSVLVTTHSPELLDAAQDEELLVCSYRNGTTRIGPLATAQREIVRERLFSLSELARSEPLRIEGDEPESLDPRDFKP
ncbi:MAG TPA: AAA family ATPase, partial [Myxococcaceae bacterium]